METIVVNSEIRDSLKVHQRIKYIIVFSFVYLTFVVGSIKCAVDFKGIFVAVSFVLLLLLIPLIVLACVWASKIYRNTWTIRQYVLRASNGSLYISDKRVHINYNDESQVFYVHDLGSFSNPSKAGIYLTIEGEDKERLAKFVEDNMILIEPEPSLQGISKYRRK